MREEAVLRAQGAASASDGMAAAATGRTAENHWATYARIQQVERQRAKAVGKGLSRKEARSSIIKSAQEMVKAGQKMLHVAEHEREAALHMIAAGEWLASTIPAPKMPPLPAGEAGESTPLFPAAP